MMAAILGRPGSRRSKLRGPGSGPVNTYVNDQGRRYRVCHTPYGRVLMVALKCPAGGERFLEIEGRRARQVIELSGVKFDTSVTVQR